MNHTGRGGQPQAHSQFNLLTQPRPQVFQLFFHHRSYQMHAWIFSWTSSSKWEICRRGKHWMIESIPTYYYVASKRGGRHAHSLGPDRLLTCTQFSQTPPPYALFTRYFSLTTNQSTVLPSMTYQPSEQGNPYYLPVYHQSLSLLWLANWRLWIMIAHSVKTTSFSSNWNAMHVLRHISVKISVAKKDSPELL